MTLNWVYRAIILYKLIFGKSVPKSCINLNLDAHVFTIVTLMTIVFTIRSLDIFIICATYFKMFLILLPITRTIHMGVVGN